MSLIEKAINKQGGEKEKLEPNHSQEKDEARTLLQNPNEQVVARQPEPTQSTSMQAQDENVSSSNSVSIHIGRLKQVVSSRPMQNEPKLQKSFA